MIPTKDELEKLYVDQLRSMKEIGGIFGVDRHKIKEWLDHFGIGVRKFRAGRAIPPKHELYDLYHNKNMTLKEIRDLYGVGKKAIRAWFSHYGIKVLHGSQKKYHHIRKVPLTQKQREFVIGTLLGDGSLSRVSKGKSYRLTMGHGSKQLDYLLWKKKTMGNLVNQIYKQSQTDRNSTIYHWASITHHEFGFFHKLFYDNTKKIVRPELIFHLTPFAMAVWFMDDGSTRQANSNMKISTEGFSASENAELQHMIKTKFGIRCKVCQYQNRGKKYNYLSFNKRNGLLLTNLIQPHVIEPMRYKLLLND